MELLWGAKTAHLPGCGHPRGYPRRTFSSWREVEVEYLATGVSPCRQCKPFGSEPVTITVYRDAWGRRVVDGTLSPATERDMAREQKEAEKMARELGRAEAWVEADIARLEGLGVT